jgi:hypothetical protein
MAMRKRPAAVQVSRPFPATAPAITPNLLIFRGFSNKQPAFPAGITRGL